MMRLNYLIFLCLATLSVAAQSAPVGGKPRAPLTVAIAPTGLPDQFSITAQPLLSPAHLTIEVFLDGAGHHDSLYSWQGDTNGDQPVYLEFTPVLPSKLDGLRLSVEAQLEAGGAAYPARAVYEPPLLTGALRKIEQPAAVEFEGRMIREYRLP